MKTLEFFVVFTNVDIDYLIWIDVHGWQHVELLDETVLWFVQSIFFVFELVEPWIKVNE